MAPITLPNVLIYLTSVVRPGLLRPHLRVPSIANIDFRALRSEGYNAVVIDKDNCLTLPNKDDIYQPYQIAWNDMLETFQPGRVLVVSNSAGTKKDPGGIAAEAVSLSLRAPVLLHAQPKPGCSPTILSYFAGGLGAPTTRRREIRQEAEKVWEEEKKDEEGLWERWNGEVTGPLLGHPKNTGQHREGNKDVKMEKQRGKEPTKTVHEKATEEKQKEGLRILVIGDRLFTDTLLAHRLSLYLPKPPRDQTLPSVLSIHTSALPEPQDVRVLRWIEDKLTRGRTKGEIYERFILCEPETNQAMAPRQVKPGRLAALRWLTPARWREIELQPLTWHPRTWKPLPLTVGLGKVLGATGGFVGRSTSKGGRAAWYRIRKWISDRRTEVQGGNNPGLSSRSTTNTVERIAETQTS
ncbi:hypothetical protein IAU60_002884 [Kwoniella sp. DSM 27419]